MLSGFGKGLVKVLASIIGGAGVGCATVGYFAVRDPEVWDYEKMRPGPPFGPIMLAVGLGLLTGAVLMGLLFWSSGRRKAPEA